MEQPAEKSVVTKVTVPQQSVQVAKVTPQSTIKQPIVLETSIPEIPAQPIKVQSVQQPINPSVQVQQATQEATEKIASQEVNSIKSVTKNQQIIVNNPVQKEATVECKSFIEHTEDNILGEAFFEKLTTDIDQLNANKISHIINGSTASNHKWEFLVPDKNWEDIKKIIVEVLTTGENDVYKGRTCKIKKFDNLTVEVTFKEVNNLIKIGSAWIR